MAVIRQFVTAGVAKHVSMSLYAQTSRDSRSLDHPRESRSA
jgi:hypothetical protein